MAATIPPQKHLDKLIIERDLSKYSHTLNQKKLQKIPFDVLQNVWVILIDNLILDENHNLSLKFPLSNSIDQCIEKPVTYLVPLLVGKALPIKCNYITVEGEAKTNDGKAFSALALDKKPTRFIRKLPTYVKGTLSTRAINTQFAFKLSNTLISNFALAHLDLSHCFFDKKCAHLLAMGIESKSNLLTLKLENNKIGDKGAEHIFQALEKNTILTTLSLERCNMRDKGAQMAARFLSHHTMIQNLNLNDNKIRNLGASYLATGISMNYSLTSFSLENNRITTTGIELIAEALHLNFSIISLSCTQSDEINKKLNSRISELLARNQRNTAQKTCTLLELLLPKLSPPKVPPASVFFKQTR